MVDVLNEGADIPFVECLLFLRPTESRRIFYQQFGRGLRRHSAKKICTVIDFIGNFQHAYRIIEYHDLLPNTGDSIAKQPRLRSSKQLLNLPIGCSVEFDDRVVDLFIEQQIHDPLFISRHNIGSILLERYELLANRLGRIPTQWDVDRNQVLDSSIYVLLFRDWKTFLEIAAPYLAGENLGRDVRKFGIEIDDLTGE